MPSQANVPDVVAGAGRGSPLAVSLKKIGSWLALLSVRLYQRFLIFVFSPDYETVIKKSFFALMLDSEGCYLTINVVGSEEVTRNK